MTIRLDRWASRLRNDERISDDDMIVVSTLLTEAANHVARRTGELVPFVGAVVGDESYIYKSDPSGEYGWVTDPEWFDDIDDPIAVTRQRWRLIDQGVVTFHPRLEMCPECSGEGGDMETGETCPVCDGSATHPLAGTIEVQA